MVLLQTLTMDHPISGVQVSNKIGFSEAQHRRIANRRRRNQVAVGSTVTTISAEEDMATIFLSGSERVPGDMARRAFAMRLYSDNAYTFA